MDLLESMPLLDRAKIRWKMLPENNIPGILLAFAASTIRSCKGTSEIILFFHWESQYMHFLLFTRSIQLPIKHRQYK